jgi:hypothetical protein
MNEDTCIASVQKLWGFHSFDESAELPYSDIELINQFNRIPKGLL